MHIDAQSDCIHQAVITNHWTRRSDEIGVSFWGEGELPSLQLLETLPTLVSAAGRLICIRSTQSIKLQVLK